MKRMRDAAAFVVPGVPAARGAEWSPRLHWQSPQPIEAAMSAPMAPSTEALKVFVNEGRWVVSCPDCSGAQLACRTDQRFMCCECANVAIGGEWRPVVWPDDAVGIERALGKRTLLRNCNWLPGETAQDLLAETAAMEVD